MLRNRWLAAAGVVALALEAAPAMAAPVSAPAPGKAIILVPLKLTKLQDLSFGTVVSAPTSGTVSIDPTSGARTVSGGVTEVLSDVGQRATFDWAGSPNQQVSFSITPPASLSDGTGDSVTIAMNISSGTATVGPTGFVEVGVGGIIFLAANQPEGIYTNTFSVTANYN